MNTFRLAFITGATSGIGKAISQKLAEKGISLIITGRCEDKLIAFQQELQKKISVIAIAADISLEQDRKKLVELLYKHTPDLVINNAGFGLYGEVLNYSTKEQLDILQVNGNAVLELSIEAAKSMLKQNKKGVILNVASTSGFFIFPQSAVYAASKAFVINLSQAFDLELQSKGIRVLVACPGMVDTHFRERAACSIKEEPSKALTMSADKAADLILWQIKKKKALYIFDWRSRWGIYLSKLVPQNILASLLSSIIKKRVVQNR